MKDKLIITESSGYSDFMPGTAEWPIGLLADSHNNNSLMTDTIKYLKSAGAQTLVHLGDVFDSQVPDNIDETVDILKKYDVRAVLGNNEITILRGFLKGYTNEVREASVSFLNSLPYILKIDDIWFAHSLPFDWGAATRWPITELLPQLLKGGPIPFRILFRGHSHSPSIIEIEDKKSNDIPVKPGESIKLHPDRLYVITVGAVEDGLCALFIPENNEIKFFSFTQVS